MPTVAVTGEAAGLLAKYELEHMVPLLGALEAREMLDVRALGNLQHGMLRVPGPQRDVTQYCVMLKELDEQQADADRLMPHGTSWYASRLLDLVEEAARTQAILDMAWVMPIPTGVCASKLAN